MKNISLFNSITYRPNKLFLHQIRLWYYPNILFSKQHRENYYWIKNYWIHWQKKLELILSCLWYFQAWISLIQSNIAVVSILLYGCATWTLTKRMEKKLHGNYTIMLLAVLNKSWRQHPTKEQLYGHLSLITKTIQVKQTRDTWHCWRSKDELISDVLQWTSSLGRTKEGRPARTYI